jgi:hypothetical protein
MYLYKPPLTQQPLPNQPPELDLFRRDVIPPFTPIRICLRERAV